MDATVSDLHHYLRNAREAVLWKLDGLSEFDARRPMVSTATNLLGLVKHLTGVELLYFGVAFGRFPTTLPVWFGEEMAPNTDMWATSDETRSSIVVAYRSACEHADDTISSTAPNTIADTPWLGPGPMSLHRVLVHVLAETERHAGHADLVRELIDGAVGRQPGNAQMLPGSLADDRTAEWWTQYRTQVEQAARSAGQRET